MRCDKRVAAEYVRSKKGMLELQTMYAWENKNSRSVSTTLTMPEKTDPYRTSETYSVITPTTKDNIQPGTEKSKTRFQLKEPIEETKDLIAAHNVDADKLNKMLDYDGIPMPSVAITKAKQGWDKFGDISLIFKKGAIDPEKSPKNNEVAAVVVPDTTPESLIEKAKERGLKVVQYDPNVEDSRKNKVNAIEGVRFQFSDIICKSSIMKDCIQRAKRMALTDFPILINGESGTGKELFAQSVHQYSARSAHPFIALNCASLSNELLESELFRYEDGAFTGAKRGGKKGLFELAQNGTIFLDEIGEMPVLLQAKLLRILQEQEIRKLGSSTTIPINVRIITATNRDLPAMIEQGHFRLDLYYRISMFTLVIPPLRERKDDILPLSEYFLKSFKPYHSITPELQELLLSYPWKGNIRELQNCVEYMAYMGFGALTPDDLPPGYSKKADTPSQTDISHFQDHLQIFNSSADFPDLFSRDEILCQRILALLYDQPMGRMRILKELNYDYTGHEIKKAFDYLHAKNWIKSSRGRGGTSLTPTGMKKFQDTQRLQ